MKGIIEYIYGNSEWKDLLTSYNGKAIAYDEIGNPTSIGTDTLTWEAGRRLSSITKNGITTTFTYDANGYRTAKTTNGVTTTYYLDDGRITAMKVGSDELSFVYDEKDSIVGLYHNGTPYVYAKNLQGDIIGIVDGTGTWVVNYTYDAWGNPLTTDGTLASTLGILNPFRYRGYVYDTETGYYYVSSRYYDSEIGRFINVDNQIASVGGDILEYNVFAYCNNNPINYFDPSGESAEAIQNTWLSTMWWLPTIDGFLPIGDVIYWGGAVLLGGIAIGGVAAKVKDKHVNDSKKEKDSNKPVVKPGQQPQKEDGYRAPKKGPIKGKPEMEKLDGRIEMETYG